MSIYIPYLIQDKITGYVQNSTVIDLSEGDSMELSILLPPRTDSMTFFIGEKNREYWPIRSQDESWNSWLIRGGAENGIGNGIQRISADNNNSYDSVNNSVITGGPVISKSILIERAMSVGVPEGGFHSSGLVHGKNVYDRLYIITDPTDSFDIVDGKVGYYDGGGRVSKSCT